MASLNSLLFDVEKVNFEEKFGMAANSDYQYAIIGKIDGQDSLNPCFSGSYSLSSPKTLQGFWVNLVLILVLVEVTL